MKEETMPNVPRKVIQCDRAGNDLREFPSIKEAQLSFGSTKGNSINKAIRHGCCAFGYRWRYAGEPLSIKPEGTPGRSRRVIAIDKDGNEDILPSLSEASRKLGIGITAIESALLMGCKAKGYHFRYEDKPMAASYKHDRHNRKVVAIDEANQIVAEYPSAKDCAASLDVIKAAVYRCLSQKGLNAKCKGYRLRYKDDIN